MKKTAMVIGVIVLVVLVLVLGWKAKNKARPIKEMVKSELLEKKGKTKQKLKDILGMGQAQKCTWQVSDENGATNGTILMSGDKFKQEVTMVSNSDKKETKMFALSDGNFVYMWNNEMGSNGLKMAVEDDSKSSYDNAQFGKVEWDAENEYECNPATISEGELTPPSEIQFQDLGAQLKQLQEMQNNFGLPQGDEQ